MIVPDVNLLLYAHNRAAPYHDAAQAWWRDLLAREQPVGVPWAVAFGFLRLVTHPAVLSTPLTATAALDHVDRWFAHAAVQPLEPGPRHLRIVRDLFAATGVGGRLTTDTHVAALAIEHQAEVHSNDADFARFPGLRWRDPLAAG